MNSFKASLLAAALLAAAPLAAQAESEFDSGSGALSASADLDFEIRIPKILLLQVGSLNSVDEIVFDMTGTPTAVGNGNPVAGTGGDATNGTVTARVLGNGGDVTLTAVTAGDALENADGDTISYSEIAVSTNNTDLTSPVLDDTVAQTSTVAAAGKIVDETAQWTYAYRNSDVVAPGVYTGRVTYTAALP